MFRDFITNAIDNVLAGLERRGHELAFWALRSNTPRVTDCYLHPAKNRRPAFRFAIGCFEELEEDAVLIERYAAQYGRRAAHTMAHVAFFDADPAGPQSMTPIHAPFLVPYVLDALAEAKETEPVELEAAFHQAVEDWRAEEGGFLTVPLVSLVTTKTIDDFPGLQEMLWRLSKEGE